MQVWVNGRSVDVPAGCTVSALLARESIDPVKVAVERNQDVVPRRSWEDCRLADGDELEIVTFVGGG
ncbi:MAG TPA: sulfur carrier protein ThiS [Polyangia bacterium]|jgi:thiamine biosynthesis protein ThiS